MITGPLNTVNPFADPHLYWCETGFAVADMTVLRHADDDLGMVEVAVPESLQSAVPKRRSEFLAGRLCAALALRQAGMAEAVGQSGRAPVWPDGVAGSITHSRDRAIAAVSTHYAGVGVDCEALVPDDRAFALCSAIFTETEAQLRPAALPFGVFFTLVFSAKEALYKARAPRLSYVPGFLDAAVTGLSRGGIDLIMDGATHRARFTLSARDCVTLLVQAD